MKQMICTVLAAVMVMFGTQGLADAAPLLTGLNESQFVMMNADVDDVDLDEDVDEDADEVDEDLDEDDEDLDTEAETLDDEEELDDEEDANEDVDDEDDAEREA